MKSTLKKVLEDFPHKASVRAISVSGQQHGFVPLDADCKVIRPAKLWCDTSTNVECAILLSKLGGLEKAIECIGNAVPAGFTASKILWLKQHEPQNYARLRHVLLPHNYLNWFLSGNMRMECGDASGMALFDVKNRSWSEKAIAAIDASLAAMLPPLIESHEIVGTLRRELAAEFGLDEKVVICSGSGYARNETRRFEIDHLPRQTLPLATT